MDITLQTDHLQGFIDPKEYASLAVKIDKAHQALVSKKCAGSEFTGWHDLPGRIKDSFLKELEALGEDVRQDSDCLITIGIGGSYLGIRASLECLGDEQKLPVYFAGHHLSAHYLSALLEKLAERRVSVVVISKSGTTTEPALAFRIIKDFLKKKYSPEELKKRIICVTDAKKGALRSIAQKDGYRTFSIDDDIGGRFSVLTPVGLVPLAIAGIDIRSMVKGARTAQEACARPDIRNNPAHQYAAARHLLYRHGKVIEVLSNFDQRLAFVSEWWKQLFGESEGKDGKGLFPASLNFTADLHSMGQMLQEGERNMFETFLVVENPGKKLSIPKDEGNEDNFNYIAGKDLDFVNKKAYQATAMAHFEGGVPNMTIELPACDASVLGQLYYFFEKAVAISGALLEVNPYDQPGVEAYKKKMFQLLRRK